MMTRTHFLAIARIMSGCQPSASSESHLNWRGACCDLASMFQAENPRFDRGKFLEACGYAQR